MPDRVYSAPSLAYWPHGLCGAAGQLPVRPGAAGGGSVVALGDDDRRPRESRSPEGGAHSRAVVRGQLRQPVRAADAHVRLQRTGRGVRPATGRPGHYQRVGGRPAPATDVLVLRHGPAEARQPELVEPCDELVGRRQHQLRLTTWPARGARPSVVHAYPGAIWPRCRERRRRRSIERLRPRLPGVVGFTAPEGNASPRPASRPAPPGAVRALSPAAAPCLLALRRRG